MSLATDMHVMVEMTKVMALDFLVSIAVIEKERHYSAPERELNGQRVNALAAFLLNSANIAVEAELVGIADRIEKSHWTREDIVRALRARGATRIKVQAPAVRGHNPPPGGA